MRLSCPSTSHPCSLLGYFLHPAPPYARVSQASPTHFLQLACHILLHWATLVEPSKSVLVFPGQRVQKF